MTGPRTILITCGGQHLAAGGQVGRERSGEHRQLASRGFHGWIHADQVGRLRSGCGKRQVIGDGLGGVGPPVRQRLLKFHPAAPWRQAEGGGVQVGHAGVEPGSRSGQGDGAWVFRAGIDLHGSPLHGAAGDGPVIVGGRSAADGLGLVSLGVLALPGPRDCAASPGPGDGGDAAGAGARGVR
jgi:hypothetical protein